MPSREAKQQHYHHCVFTGITIWFEPNCWKEKHGQVQTGSPKRRRPRSWSRNEEKMPNGEPGGSKEAEHPREKKKKKKKKRRCVRIQVAGLVEWTRTRQREIGRPFSSCSAGDLHSNGATGSVGWRLATCPPQFGGRTNDVVGGSPSWLWGKPGAVDLTYPWRRHTFGVLSGRCCCCCEENLFQLVWRPTFSASSKQLGGHRQPIHRLQSTYQHTTIVPKNIVLQKLHNNIDDVTWLVFFFAIYITHTRRYIKMGDNRTNY